MRMSHRARWALWMMPVPIFAQSTVYFDESASDRVRMGNAAFEVSFSKTNGAILAITDKNVNQSLTLGSRNGCLWMAESSTSSASWGCTFTNTGANKFAYSWVAGTSTLTLTYTPAAGTQNVSATVQITASSQSYFDMALAVKNQTGAQITSLSFPQGLVFNVSAISAAYFPYFPPGIRLLPGFFASHKTAGGLYPGATGSMDYLALESSQTTLAWYSVNPNGPLQPVQLLYIDDSAKAAGTYYAVHLFQTWIGNGASYSTATVRVRVGSGISAGLLAYRADNGFGNYPSVAQKVGAPWNGLIRSPMVRLDFSSPKANFAGAFNLDSFPSPALLHAVTYWNGGFNSTFPDYLPPNPTLGTNPDFAAWIQSAHARGQTVMPYTNTMIWDPGSPTVTSLPPPVTAAQLAALDVTDKPVTDTFGATRFLDVSPYVPFVQQRLTQAMAQFQTDVPVDFVFHDEIGSHGWILDRNPAAPDPLRYADGWVAFVNKFAGQGLMTEDGYDRLAHGEIAFMGSPLNTTPNPPDSTRWFSQSIGNRTFGIGNWEPYPLLTAVVHDKVLTYMHNLESATQTNNLDVFTWNLLFGNILSYWSNADPKWATLAAAAQRLVGPHYAGAALASFTMVAPQVRQARYTDLTVTANWSDTAIYTLNGYDITARGVMAQSDDGSVLAGVFNGNFNGAPLSAGDHYILEHRDPHYTEVRQPIGADTEITVDAPLAWQPGQQLAVNAIDQDGNLIQPAVSFTIDNNQVTFLLSASVGSVAVSRYDIANMDSSFPVAVNAASLLRNAIAPGEMVTILGSGLGPQSAVMAGTDANGIMQTLVAGTQILFDGVPAPLVSVQDGMSTAVVPYEVAGQGVTEIQVVYNGAMSPILEVPVAAASPGIFAVNNADGSVNSAANSAAAGTELIVYATGEGQTSPAGVDGQFANDASPTPLLPVSVVIGGQTVAPDSAEGAPGMVAGVIQIKVQLPAGLTGSTFPLQLKIGGYRSANSTTVAIQ